MNMKSCMQPQDCGRWGGMMQDVEFKHFKLKVEDGIAIFTICREDKLNALNPDAWDDIDRFSDYIEKNDEIKAAIITGSGDKAFIAGADIGGVASMDTLAAIHRTSSDTQVVLTKLENNRKPIVAAINGYCLGGGFELAMACDIRIVSENALLGLPETNLGILPGAGGTQRLARIAGIGVAKQMILLGIQYTGQEAVARNLAAMCVPQDQLMATAKKMVVRMTRKGPLGLEFAKKAINMSLDTDEKTGMYIERLSFALLLGTEDKKEGTNAFLEKRHAVFKGR